MLLYAYPPVRQLTWTGYSLLLRLAVLYHLQSCYLLIITCKNIIPWLSLRRVSPLPGSSEATQPSALIAKLNSASRESTTRVFARENRCGIAGTSTSPSTSPQHRRPQAQRYVFQRHPLSQCRLTSALKLLTPLGNTYCCVPLILRVSEAAEHEYMPRIDNTSSMSLCRAVPHHPPHHQPPQLPLQLPSHPLPLPPARRPRPPQPHR